MLVAPRHAYTVTFRKQLCDSTGHPHWTEQGRVVVTDAVSEEQAVEKAKFRFARSQGLADWRCHADHIEVRLVCEGERLS